MESDDEFNQFVMNELIDPSSSDDENDLFFGAVHMIIEDLVRHHSSLIRVELVLSKDLVYWIVKDCFGMVFVKCVYLSVLSTGS